MELHVTKREKGTVKQLSHIRREGNIPAIIYSKGEKGQEIVVDGKEFQKLLNSIEKQTLSSKILTLTLDGQKKKVIVKSIQYKKTNYQILHLDFQELVEGRKINVRIPLKPIGSQDCVGVKAGGVLRQIIYSVPVRVDTKKIPSHFEINVSDLELGATKKVNQANIDPSILVTGNFKEVAFVVGKR